MPFNEANTDGSIVVGEQFLEFNPLEIIRAALSLNNWNYIESTHSGASSSQGNLILGARSKNITLTIGKIQNQEEGRNPNEKRIQISRANTTIGFNHVVTEDNSYALFGVYRREDYDDIIIVAWPKEVIANPNTQISVRVKIDLIARALTNGFDSSINEAGQMICAFRPEFIHYYLLNQEPLHSIPSAEIQADPFGDVPTSHPPIESQEPLDPQIPRNKIIYGAPGTGKSYELRDQARTNGFSEDNTIRVTFHPNYTYQQFIGSYKPSPIYKNVQSSDSIFGSDKTTQLEGNDKKEPLIDYSFIPGPLLNLLVKALRNSDQNYLLIIEEINRAPVSSVFGDVFQLLDRKEDGTSEYSITFSNEAMSFFRANEILNTEIILPNNLFIWATMNSADQGVMPLDAAFKRRWTFEYLPLDAKQTVVADRSIQFQGVSYNWNAFRKQVNDKLKSLEIAEDKLIGPFFMNRNELMNNNSIKNKLLLYLRDDVVRHDPSRLFVKSTYSDIMKMYDDGVNIFSGFEITNPSNDQPAETASEE